MTDDPGAATRAGVGARVDGAGDGAVAVDGGGRRKLDRDRIVAAALQLARAGGVPAVTMRRVADALDAGAMSLYRHVVDRQELLVAMLDAVAADLTLPPVVDDPRAELTAVLTALRDAFHRERWMPHVLAVDGLASAGLLPVAERVLAALDRAGLHPADVVGASALLWHHAYGEGLASHHDRDGAMAERVVRHAVREAPQTYPTVARLSATAPPPGNRHDFATNLGRVLDGILGARATATAATCRPRA